MATKTSKKGGGITLLVSDEKSPSIALKAGMSLEVVAIKLQGPQLGELKKLGARLCGGSGTCLALVDPTAKVSNPPRKPTVRGKTAKSSRATG